MSIFTVIGLCVSVVVLTGVALSAIVAAWWYFFTTIFDVWMSFKAIYYTLLASDKRNDELFDFIGMKKDREWYVHYKGKDYLWRCIKVEERNKRNI